MLRVVPTRSAISRAELDNSSAAIAMPLTTSAEWPDAAATEAARELVAPGGGG